MSNNEKLPYYTMETRDVLSLAERLAHLVAEHGLRELRGTLQKGAVNITVEVKK